MRKNLSKFKNKPSKGTEQRSDALGVAGSSRGNTERIGQGKDFCVYNVNANQTKQFRERGPPDDLVYRSSTAYDTFTSSTSESDPDRLFHLDRRYKDSSKVGRKYREDPEVCITVPEEGKGKGGVRIVANASRTKQVEFASLDAVYGTPPTSVISSDDETGDEGFGKERIRVYRAEGRERNAFLRDSRESGNSVRRDGEQVIHVDEEETNKNSGAKCSPKNSRLQPALTAPLITVNIETSQEEMDREKSGTDDTSNSRLTRIKQKLLENSLGGLEVNGNKTGTRADDNKVQSKVGNVGSKSMNQVYYVESEGRDMPQIQGALQQLLSMSNERQFSNGLTQPLTYVATVNGNNIMSLQRIESLDQNKVSITKISPKSSPKDVLFKKSSSRQSARKNVEVIGSKIVIKRSKMSILKSSIPKPSSKITRKSSVTADKNRNIDGSGSIKYAVRDVAAAPDDQTGKQFGNIYQPQPINNEMPEEKVMLTEREIKSHTFEDAPKHSKTIDASKTTDSLQIQQVSLYRKSLEKDKDIGNTPCLYYCSTSAIDARPGSKSDTAYEVKPEVENVLHGVTSDSSFGSVARRSKKAGDKKNELSLEAKPNNTIVIDNETHKELMEAIDATSGKDYIISLPTKISRRDTNGNQLSIKAKRSNKQLSITRRISAEAAPREVKDNTKRVSFKGSSLVKRENKAKIEADSKTANGSKKRSSSYQEPETKIVNPFTGKSNTGNNIGITAYPMQLNPNGNNPMYYDNFNDDDKEILNNTVMSKASFTKAKAPKPLKKEELKEPSPDRTVLSFSEPVIQEGSENSLGEILLGDGNGTASKLRKSKTKASKTYDFQTPENMVYVGRLPNTSYNVFFSPDSASQPAKTKGTKKSKNDNKKLRPIRSEKLLAQGPKAILIFVNKKTELNRNPFDGNVIYDEYNSDYYMKGKGKEKKPKDRDGKGKYGKGRKKSKNGKYGRSHDERDFDVNSWRDPNRADGLSGRSDDRTIVEKSPSGMKTVTKYACRCMKITKIDPVTGSVTEETTSAFCTLGSKCDIGQTQRDKRVIRYAGDSRDYGEPSFDRTMSYGGNKGGSGGRGGWGSPQLDVVLDGIVSKKPIPERQPAPTMKGANLTGTLTIKTNRCNGVINFYLDPRIKRCLANKLSCLSDGNDHSHTATIAKYSSSAMMTNNYSNSVTFGEYSYSRMTSHSRQ